MFKKVWMAVGLACMMGMLTACSGSSEQKTTEIRVAFNQIYRVSPGLFLRILPV